MGLIFEIATRNRFAKLSGRYREDMAYWHKLTADLSAAKLASTSTRDNDQKCLEYIFIRAELRSWAAPRVPPSLA